MEFGWLVGFGFNGPLRQYFSLHSVCSIFDIRDITDVYRNAYLFPGNLFSGEPADFFLKLT